MAIPSKEPSSIRPMEQRGEPREPQPGAQEAPRPGIDQLREILERAVALVRRQRRGFLVVAGGSGAVLLFGVLLQTPLYESSSLLLVKFGRELVYQPEVGTDQAFAARDKQSVINSELAIVRSRPVLDAAVRQVGLASVYPDLGEALEEIRAGEGAGALEGQGADDSALRDAETLIHAEAVNRMAGALSAHALPETDVLEIAYQHTDPIVAAQVVNALVDNFLEAHLTAFGEPKVVGFLERRVEEYQERLDASEQALLEFETEHAAFALENPQSALVEWRDAAQAELGEIEAQMATIRLRHLQEDATVAEARNQLLQLQMEASQLDGELLAETQDRIRVVQRFIQRRKNEVGGELSSLEEKKAELEEKVELTARELAELPALSARYRSLVRQRDADEEQYRTYAKRLRDARLSSEMDREKMASINVIQPASPSPQPVWPPQKSVTVPVALVLALLAGSLAAVLLDRIGPTGIRWLDEDRSRDG